MHKYGRIIAGLILFIAILSIPIFYEWGKTNKGPLINLNTPGIEQLTNKQCVEPPEWMRANHMQLLLKWRDEMVRQGQTVYVNSQGQSFEIGLNTCMKCHSDPSKNQSDQFCVSCHTYVGVKPTCWSCHNWPQAYNKSD